MNVRLLLYTFVLSSVSAGLVPSYLLFFFLCYVAAYNNWRAWSRVSFCFTYVTLLRIIIAVFNYIVPDVGVNKKYCLVLTFG